MNVVSVKKIKENKTFSHHKEASSFLSDILSTTFAVLFLRKYFSYAGIDEGKALMLVKLTNNTIKETCNCDAKLEVHEII
ncbi:CLUMA_CG010236, isoform A [Clunio marinus]|uniref:CLUMA_CG010236, isoform A n=1 Tax=Clunio marinus TaxID=568069 RepID=A0A1J1ID39_9DIPT|nr:CLUMA_CG010236, isoform A [Clunio marinus]